MSNALVPAEPGSLESLDLGKGLMVCGTPEAVSKVKELLLHQHLADFEDVPAALRDVLQPLYDDRDRINLLQDAIRAGNMEPFMDEEEVEPGPDFDLRARIDEAKAKIHGS